MGLFDYVRCHYPLPVEGANELEYQTKDMDWPYMDRYEIRADGTLWKEHYDTEDRSDPNAEPGSIDSFIGCMTRVRKRWEPEPYTGALEFYKNNNGRRLEFAALFKDGRIAGLVDNSDPANAALTGAEGRSPKASG